MLSRLVLTEKLLFEEKTFGNRFSSEKFIWIFFSSFLVAKIGLWQTCSKKVILKKLKKKRRMWKDKEDKTKKVDCKEKCKKKDQNKLVFSRCGGWKKNDKHATTCWIWNLFTFEKWIEIWHFLSQDCVF